MPSVIADNLRRLLEERGLDANTLAVKLGYGNRAMVDHWLSGRRVPTPGSLRRVAEVLNVTLKEIDPSGSAYVHTGPRRKTLVLDNPSEVGKIPDSHLPTTTTAEGLMRDQVERLKSALSLVPEGRRDYFMRRVSVLAAQLLLEEEEPGTMPGKRARASGKG